VEPEKEDGWLSGGMLGGLGIMLLAAIWFVSGLPLGRILLYPAVMFVVGLGTFIKGWLDSK